MYQPLVLHVAETFITSKLFVGAQVAVGIFGDENFLQSCKAKDDT